MLLVISKTFGLNGLKKLKQNENRTIHKLGLLRINDCDDTLSSMDLHRICLQYYSRSEKMGREAMNKDKIKLIAFVIGICVAMLMMKYYL